MRNYVNPFVSRYCIVAQKMTANFIRFLFCVTKTNFTNSFDHIFLIALYSFIVSVDIFGFNTFPTFSLLSSQMRGIDIMAKFCLSLML